MVIMGSANDYPNKQMNTEIATSGLQMHNGDVVERRWQA